MTEQILCFLAAATVIGFIKLCNVINGKPQLGYKEYMVTKKGRTAEIGNAVICLLIWIAIFLYGLFSDDITMIPTHLLSLLLGGMSGIAIATIYTLYFMPKGFYEKGILSETRIVPYRSINRCEIIDTKRNHIKKLVIYQKSQKKQYLFLSDQELKKVKLILKEHKL